MSEQGMSYAEQLLDALDEARMKLRGRIKCPVTLEIAVGTELAGKLKAEYLIAAGNSHLSQERITELVFSNRIPELTGHRVYVDDGLTPNWYEIRMTVKKGVVK